jgi:hypothetical protein
VPDHGTRARARRKPTRDEPRSLSAPRGGLFSTTRHARAASATTPAFAASRAISFSVGARRSVTPLVGEEGEAPPLSSAAWASRQAVTHASVCAP